MSRSKPHGVNNKIYSEIIFKLAGRKESASEFSEGFYLMENIGNTDRLLTKSQSVLSRQMKFLAEQGFLNTITTQESGKRLRHNEKLFEVNFEKIIDSFLDTFLDYVQEKRESFAGNEEIKESLNERVKAVKSQRFRNLCKKNFFVQYLFKFLLIKIIRQHIQAFKDYTLQEIFELLTKSNSLAWLADKIFEEAEEILGRNGKELPRRHTLYRPDEKTIKKSFLKEYKKDFDFFEHEFLTSLNFGSLDLILGTMSGSIEFAPSLPSDFARILLKGVNEKGHPK